MYSLKEDKKLEIPDDYSIYNFYLPNFKLGEMRLSPLRKENNPSFNVFTGRGGKLLWKDFGSGISGSAIDLVMALFGLTYKGALERTSQDLSGATLFLGLPNKPITIKEQKPTDIKIKSRPFSKVDLNYWGMFGITEDTLKHFEVYSISHYWVNDKIIYVKKDQLTYAYSFSGRFKIYSPYSEFKWVNNADVSCIQGFAQLAKKGELLVISKALKDVMVLYNYGISAIAPQSETVLLDSKIMNSLFKRFDNIVTFFDSDQCGQALAKQYYDKYKIYGLEVPKNCCAKDIADYYLNFGSEDTKELLIHLALI